MKEYKEGSDLSLQYQSKGYIVLQNDEVRSGCGLAIHFSGNIKALLENNKSKKVL